jgi:GlpG protein
LPDEKQARLFGEREGDDRWLIWVLDDEQLDAGAELLGKFRADPGAPEFSREAAAADALRKREEQEQAAWRRRVHNRRRVFPGMQQYKAGLISYVLMVACILLAFYSQSVFVNWRDPSQAEARNACMELLRPFFISFAEPGGAGFLPEVLRGEVWRLFTPMFIHFSVQHIVFNLMWLFQIGSMIESAQGSRRFFLLVAVFSLASNLVQYSVHHQHWNFGGMSGVNYGLIGYVWIRGKFDPGSGLHLDKASVILSIVFFFLCFTGWLGPIANAAHAAGLVCGMAWGWISAKLALRSL